MGIGLLLWLLLAKGLSMEGAVGATFSSRLIHRFSEEAKAHLASRGNKSSVLLQAWPQRNSSEYFRLLLRSDVARQRMRLGSQYETLYPSEGGQTFFFGNALYWLHYTWIDIGTPNVSFLVALDAGSDMLWVPCDCIECASLSADAPFYMGASLMQDRDLNQYRPSLSNTSRHLPCGHKLCDVHSFCKGSKDPCPYEVQYASANTSSSGYVFEDKLHLTSDGKHAEQNSVQASIILGCGRKQTGDYLHGAGPDGVLGLGPGNISVPSLLAKAGLIQNSFSICLDENESGRIIFGDQGHVTQHSTPFLPIIAYMVGVESFCVGSLCLKETRFQALIDSGSSFTFLPNEVYQKVVTEELVNIPPLKLAFSRNQTFLIQNPIFYDPASQEQEYTIFCLPVSPSADDYAAIGRQDRASFTSPSNGGSPNPLPANQQQTVPNARGVPPAIAGHTSPKPSAATPGLVTTSRHSLASLLLICHLWLWLSC
ncbi:Aspartic proteinase-like protein 1 [Glycine max]|nr:Aspartic proteinase-like protein 1 [Glycine max]